MAVTLSGFSAAPCPNITVQVGQTVPIDVRMRPAGVDETINVIADAPLLDTQRTDVSNVFGQDVIQNLPLNGRRWDQFVMLGPGVTNDGKFGLISYRGISGLYNNNMVDGVDNNQAFFSEARGRTRAVYSISASAIKEFQVGVSNMSAEFGRAAGGTVNAVTKSGTNAFSGELFYFLRDKAFQAQDPFIPDASGTRSRSAASSSGRASAVRSRETRCSSSSTTISRCATFPPFTSTSSATFYSGACTISAANCAATTDFYRSLEVTEPARSEQQGGRWPHRLGDQPGEQLLDQLQRPALGLAERHQYRRGAVPGEFRQRQRHRQDRLLGHQPEHGLQPEFAQRAARADRPRLRRADAERGRSEHGR